MALLFSVSGLRGTIPDGLSPDAILKYTRAFASWVPEGPIWVGRDARPHGPMVLDFVAAMLQAMGREVRDAGLIPTPSLLYLVREHRAPGGILVTASHNPLEWNALKFVVSGGRFPFADELESFRSFLEHPGAPASWHKVGRRISVDRAWEAHVEAIVTSPWVAREAIREKAPRVLVDCVNGAMSAALPALLERLGARVARLHCTPDGTFPRPPEPREEHLRALHDRLVHGEADLGFATDPDGDRLVVGLGGKGVLSEEATVPLAFRYVLSRERGPLVVNYSTSRWVDEVAAFYQVPVVRAPVGEANVLQAIRDHHALGGGEGNGGVIFPTINAARDGLVAAALVLSLWATRGEEAFTLSPRFRIKERLPRHAVPSPELFQDLGVEEISGEDGVYLRQGETWVHLRPSNTEPIVRLYGESPDAEALKALLQEVRKRYQGGGS